MPVYGINEAGFKNTGICAETDFPAGMSDQNKKHVGAWGYIAVYT